MTLDEAFALVRENGLKWHSLYEKSNGHEWYVILKTTNTHNGLLQYGFGQHLELIEAIRKAVVNTKEHEEWQPNQGLKIPISAKISHAMTHLGLTEDDILAAINQIKGDRK